VETLSDEFASQRQLAITERFEGFINYMYPIALNIRRTHGIARDRLTWCAFWRTASASWSVGIRPRWRVSTSLKPERCWALGLRQKAQRVNVDKSGTRTNGANSGSRASNWNNYPWNSNWNIAVTISFARAEWLRPPAQIICSFMVSHATLLRQIHYAVKGTSSRKHRKTDLQPQIK
jgi:hypothetical protein